MTFLSAIFSLHTRSHYIPSSLSQISLKIVYIKSSIFHDSLVSFVKRFATRLLYLFLQQQVPRGFLLTLMPPRPTNQSGNVITMAGHDCKHCLKCLPDLYVEIYLASYLNDILVHQMHLSADFPACYLAAAPTILPGGPSASAIIKTQQPQRRVRGDYCVMLHIHQSHCNKNSILLVGLWSARTLLWLDSEIQVKYL